MSFDRTPIAPERTGGLIDIETEDTLRTTLAEHDEVIVDFFADWCGPCQQQTPIMEELAGRVDAPILSVDTDEFQSLAAQAGVRSIPTIVVYRSGEEVERFVGITAGDTIRHALE
ncbi:thioredoxin family protein [Natronoarchaeum sp. GCM10025703]|uniref:thioredoxin family protein n=1 Tax=unclassified Natronoarchaeum TaxID=2620183 RepID=UPI0036237011